MLGILVSGGGCGGSEFVCGFWCVIADLMFGGGDVWGDFC